MSVDSATSDSLTPIEFDPLSDHPLVSVIISNFNYAHLLGEAIESVLSQTYDRFEIIVCDDGSTDNSREVIEHWVQRDRRVRGLFQSNQGQAAAWNAAYDASSGDLLCFLDPDDLFYPNKLIELIAAFGDHPKAGLACHRLQPVDHQARVISAAIPREIDDGWRGIPSDVIQRWGNWPPTSGICLRSEVAEQLFPLPLEFSNGNGDAYVQVAGRFLTEIVSVPLPLGAYRIHQTNDSARIRPTSASLSVILASLPLIIDAVVAFLRRKGYLSLADQFHVEELRMYWEYQLAVFVLANKSMAVLGGQSPETLLLHIDNPRRRWMWRAILLLPCSVSKWIIQTGWGMTRWRRIAWGVGRKLGIR